MTPKLRITTYDMYGTTHTGEVMAAKVQFKVEVLDGDGMAVAEAVVGMSGKIKHGVHVNYVDLKDAQSGVSNTDLKENPPS